MKTYLALATGFVGLLAARSVFPCGAPFGSGINVSPQQDIIVVHKNGVETYVFQPTFCGTATNFGLILPVPATLAASPALSDQQAFTTVVNLSQPTYVTLTSCSLYNGGRGGITPGGGAPDAGATVVSSGRVGFLDWVQLKADTEKSFTDWLTTNGYPYSTAASSAFSYYVLKGWYFVAFKIGQGATPDGGSGTNCNALIPVKLSFASPVPIVPSRMASAGSATTSYGSGFSWRIFGITPGDQQLAFSDGANSNRVLGYSGVLTAADIPSLAGLAAAGDRLTKLTLTFSYASMDPDVGLSLASATDYRQTIYTTQYVYCADAGTAPAVDAIPVFPDARTPDAPVIAVPDASGGLDVPFIPDAEPAVDTSAPVVSDARISPDTAPQVVPDAGTTPDAPPVAASTDAAATPDAAVTPTADLSTGGGGCSVAGGSTSGGCLALALLGLAVWIRRRRRR
jgi:MYXO-CTERM domain-containing protein